MENWAAAKPLGRSGRNRLSHQTRCPTPVLDASSLENRVLPSPRLGSETSSFLKPLGNFVQLGALRSQGLGPSGAEPDFRFSGSSLKFKFPLLMLLFLGPTAAPESSG